MKVLLTGASSFTGFWFANALVKAGAQVTAALRGGSGYEGLCAQRIAHLASDIRIITDCPFGSEPFLALIRQGDFDCLCHHGAETYNYRSLDFDAAAATAANTYNIVETLRLFAERGGQKLVVTGSVFEADEGVGPAPRRAFSPYGLSKTLTFQILRFWAEHYGLLIQKFVIANPFGPYEEKRFVAEAVRCWQRGAPVVLRAPDCVRDNIHVSLLAKIYARFVFARGFHLGPFHIGPCGYVETQEAFTRRLARELGGRLNLLTPIERAGELLTEPRVRLNCDDIDPILYGFDESQSWDALALWYEKG